MASFDIILRSRASLHPDGEPTEFVSEFSGVIASTDDETGEVTRVGKAHALRVHAGLAENAGEALFEVCDAHSHELHLLHTLLYEPDLLVLDFVILAPRWRRLKLGLLAVRRLADLVGGGCGLAVSLIAPLRHDAHSLLKVPASWLPRHANKQERREATVRLRRYFRRMGFRRLGRSPYYALPMNRVTPSADELLGVPPGT